MFCLHCPHVHSFFGSTELKTCHCAEFRFFWTEEASNWSTWRLFEFTERFSRLKQSLPGSLFTVELYYTITAEHYGNCDCRNCWKDWAALSCHWPWFDWLPTGKVQPTGGEHTESACTGLRKCFQPLKMLAPTLAEFEAAEINDLLLVTQAVTAVRNSLWDTEEHCTEPRMASVNCCTWQHDWWDCMGFAMQSLAQTVPATAFHWQHCIPADVRNWQALKNAETLFPNCKMPHSSYTLAEFNCYGKLWTWDCGDPDWTGFQRWCGHHWPDCTKHVLCDLTEHCQEDLGHWTDSCGTVH